MLAFSVFFTLNPHQDLITQYLQQLASPRLALTYTTGSFMIWVTTSLGNAASRFDISDLRLLELPAVVTSGDDVVVSVSFAAWLVALVILVLEVFVTPGLVATVVITFNNVEFDDVLL